MKTYFKSIILLTVCSSTHAQTPIYQFPSLKFSGTGSTLIETKPNSFIGASSSGLFGLMSTGQVTGASSFANSAYPVAQGGPLTPASDGYYYGVRLNGGSSAEAYKTYSAGSPITVINDQLGSAGPLVEAFDGNLWGTMGSDSAGYSIFKLSLSGQLTTVATGPTLATLGPLLQATDGNFYGATATNSDSPLPGQIYRVTPGGDYTVLHTFPQGEGSVGGLMQASNGTIYGTAIYGSSVCPDLAGEVFSLSVSGQFETLYSFTNCYPTGGTWGPEAGLVEASDGHLYGTTVSTGTGSDGNVFRMSLDGGSVQLVGTFFFDNGADPYTFGPALIQGSDGVLYGISASGGAANQAGVVFSLNLGLAPPLPLAQRFRPNSGPVGTRVRIKGNHLVGLSSVSFNGVPAQFTTVNVNYAYAVVPQGATTGPISVTTMNGTSTTNFSFTVQ